MPPPDINRITLIKGKVKEWFKKKMGRPTDAPKIIVKRARMSESDVEKLKECCKILKMSESDVLRKGIDEVYQKLKK